MGLFHFQANQIYLFNLNLRLKNGIKEQRSPWEVLFHDLCCGKLINYHCVLTESTQLICWWFLWDIGVSVSSCGTETDKQIAAHTSLGAHLQTLGKRAGRSDEVCGPLGANTNFPPLFSKFLFFSGGHHPKTLKILSLSASRESEHDSEPAGWCRASWKQWCFIGSTNGI